jgi:hypothetical protein
MPRSGSLIGEKSRSGGSDTKRRFHSTFKVSMIDWLTDPDFAATVS